MSQRSTYISHLNEYAGLKDAILEHTEEFHDSMLFDISGYEEQLISGDLDELDDLISQVKAFRQIYAGLTAINYKFG